MGNHDNSASSAEKEITREDARRLTDQILGRAIALSNKTAPIDLILERMLVFVAAQTVFDAGHDQAIRILKATIAEIEGGTFDRFQSERFRPSKPH